ncbi:hypothetical protein D3C81_1399750 [compost metagenome]
MAPVLLADLKHALAIADAGIVEHHVDHAERGFGGVEGGFDAGPIGDVHGHCQGLATALTQRFGQFVQTFHAARGQNHPRPGTAGNAGEVGADTTGSTGDQHGSATQGEGRGDVFLHGLILFVRGAGATVAPA